MNFLCKEDKRKTKGYLFDSLVYRYIRAREHMAECEYLRDRSSPKSTESHDWLTYKKKWQIETYYVL